ncbi:hypothetical protein BC940DRAFT_301574 [Gongronella butleri]|nr:hypothetical protein BC940DRAFT_301574 [Gongronella butleri]
MSSALDMALDDVISSTRKQRGGVRKQTTRGGARNTQQNRRSTRSTPSSAPRPKAPSGPRNSLLVANLHTRVNEKDLYELFGQIGKVKRAYIHLGPNGQSSGVANVVFQDENAAKRARDTYNNVSLDGRPMNISFTELPGALASVVNPINRRIQNTGRQQQQNQGGAPHRSSRGGGRQQGGRQQQQQSGGRGGRRQQRQSRPTPNQADLDAEMDTYMASEDTNMG